MGEKGGGPKPYGKQAQSRGLLGGIALSARGVVCIDFLRRLRE
jgi:hypothetical protein